MAASQVGVDKFSLVAIFVECILYGIFVLLFAASIFLVVRRHDRGSAHTRMLSIGLIMFILGTIHVSVDLRRLLDAFVYTEPPKTAIQSLAGINNVSYILKESTYYLQTMLGDGFWLYRLHVVWKGDKRVTIPFTLLLLAGGGIGLRILALFGEAPDHGDPVFSSEIHTFISTFFVLTLAANLGCTLLIATRLYYVHRQVSAGLGREAPSDVLPTFAMLVIESGAIYSAFLIVLLVTYACNSYAQYIANDGVVQVIGIVFCMMMFRTTLGFGTQFGSTGSGSHLTSSAFKSRERHTNPAGFELQERVPHVSPHKPVLVHVTKWTDRKEPDFPYPTAV